MADDDNGELPPLPSLLRQVSLETRDGTLSLDRKAHLKDLLLSGNQAKVRLAAQMLSKKEPSRTSSASASSLLPFISEDVLALWTEYLDPADIFVFSSVSVDCFFASLTPRLWKQRWHATFSQHEPPDAGAVDAAVRDTLKQHEYLDDIDPGLQGFEPLSAMDTTGCMYCRCKCLRCTGHCQCPPTPESSFARELAAWRNLCGPRALENDDQLARPMSYRDAFVVCSFLLGILLDVTAVSAQNPHIKCFAQPEWLLCGMLGLEKVVAHGLVGALPKRRFTRNSYAQIFCWVKQYKECIFGACRHDKSLSQSDRDCLNARAEASVNTHHESTWNQLLVQKAQNYYCHRIKGESRIPAACLHIKIWLAHMQACDIRLRTMSPFSYTDDGPGGDSDALRLADEMAQLAILSGKPDVVWELTKLGDERRVHHHSRIRHA